MDRSLAAWIYTGKDWGRVDQKAFLKAVYYDGMKVAYRKTS
jgi:hypothetical protein